MSLIVNELFVVDLIWHMTVCSNENTPYGLQGMGIDMSPLFTEQAKRRAAELGVSDRVRFVHDDAAGYVADEKVGVAACVGATWIAGGVAGTIQLLAQSLSEGGLILIGEPY